VTRIASNATAFILSVCVSANVCAASKAAGAAASSSSPATAATAATSTGSGSTAAFESQMLAYGAMDHVASQIVREVCQQLDQKPKSTLIIYDQASFASIAAFQSFRTEVNVVDAAYKTLWAGPHVAGHLSELSESYRTLAHSYESSEREVDKERVKKFNLIADAYSQLEQPASLVNSPTAPSWQGVVSTLVPFLSAVAVASNAETPGSINIPDSAMALSLTRLFEFSKGCGGKISAVDYPPLFGSGSASDIARVDIEMYLKTLNDSREYAHSDADGANKSFMREMATTVPNPSGADPNQHSTGDPNQHTSSATVAIPKGPVNPVLTAAVAEVDGLYDSLVNNTLFQVNGTTGQLGTASIVMGQQLETVLSNEKQPAYILLASIVAAGGTQQTHKSIWTELWKGDRIYYSGGVVVNFSLWRADTANESATFNPEIAKVLRYRTPFKMIDDPSDPTGVSAGDNFAPLKKCQCACPDCCQDEAAPPPGKTCMPKGS
jgi:hypothetical protein